MKAEYIIDDCKISEFNYGDIIRIKNHSGYRRLLVCQHLSYYSREKWIGFFDLGRGRMEDVPEFYYYDIGFPDSEDRRSLLNNKDYLFDIVSNKNRVIRKRIKKFNTDRGIDKIGHKSIIKTKLGNWMVFKFNDDKCYNLLNMNDYTLFTDYYAKNIEEVYNNFTGSNLLDDILGYLTPDEYDLYLLDKLGRYDLCNNLIADTGYCCACIY